MLKRFLGTGLVMLTAGVMGVACSGSEDNGTVVSNWTIAGGVDPQSCSRAGATSMRLVVLDSGGFVEATQFAPCESFSTSLSLNPDFYTATATFLNPSNVAISKTLFVSGFNVIENQTTTIDIPFQASDFL